MKTCKIRKQVWKCKQLFFLLGINFMPLDSQFIFYQENNWDPNIWCNIQVFCNTSSPDFSNFCLLQNPHNILLLSRALIFLMERDDVGGQMAERQRLICLKKKKSLLHQGFFAKISMNWLHGYNNKLPLATALWLSDNGKLKILYSQALDQHLWEFKYCTKPKRRINCFRGEDSPSHIFEAFGTEVATGSRNECNRWI